jgi:RNA ligase (TIGR02306 family)
MSKFEVKITKVISVEDHPNADRLSVMRLNNMSFLTISGKLEDGSHRYKEGDYVAYIPEAAILPEWLLKRLDFWNDETGKGTLNGPDGNRVKTIKLRGVVSTGILYPCRVGTPPFNYVTNPLCIENDTTKNYAVAEGDDVAEFLSIQKYEPPIPIHMAGQVTNVFGHLLKFDFENWQSVPDIFIEEEDTIVATEKLHGTFCEIGFTELVSDDLFGQRKNIIVSSKGFGGRGLGFTNSEENNGNLYVKCLKKLLSEGLEESVIEFTTNLGRPITLHIFGEIFGGSVQDLKYGMKEPDFRVFDIALDGVFLGYLDFKEMADFLELQTVPVLYRGPFIETKMKSFRDGKTTFGEANIREGIVIKTMQEKRHPLHGRKIAKMISPDYLLRKGDATEYN